MPVYPDAFHPSGLPLAHAPGVEPAALRLSPELRTPPSPAAHVRGRDRPSSTDLKQRSRHQSNLRSCVFTQCVRPRVARRHARLVRPESRDLPSCSRGYSKLTALVWLPLSGSGSVFPARGLSRRGSFAHPRGRAIPPHWARARGRWRKPSLDLANDDGGDIPRQELVIVGSTIASGIHPQQTSISAGAGFLAPGGAVVDGQRPGECPVRQSLPPSRARSPGWLSGVASSSSADSASLSNRASASSHEATAAAAS
jgi:hypothetical protein